MAPVELKSQLIAEGLIFGEGIRWRGEEIVLSDMLGERVVGVDPGTGAIRTLLDVPHRPNGLVVIDDGTILVLSMYEQKVLRLFADGSTEVYADLSGLATGYLGDVVMHPNGDLYVDDVGVRLFHGEPIAPVGRLILVKPDGSARSVLEGLAFPNGVALSADGRTLSLVQSLASPSSITAYDIDDDGSLRELGIFATAEKPMDGVAPDDEGGIWACVPQSQKIRRFDEDGVATHEVAVDGYEPIACTIGGPDGRTMAVVGIRSLDGLNIFEEMQHKRVRASVFLADVPYAKRLTRP